MLTGCRDYRPRLTELARGAVAGEEHRRLMAHVASCVACGQALEGQQALSAAFESLAVDGLPETAAIEARVLAEFDRVQGARRRSRWLLVAGLAAAVLLGMVWVGRWTSAPSPRSRVELAAVPVVRQPAPALAQSVAPEKPVHPAAARPKAQEEARPFLTIPYTVPLSPEERTTVMRMDISVAALLAAGFSVQAPDTAAVVEADVLVSQDGRARAIRPLSISQSW